MNNKIQFVYIAVFLFLSLSASSQAQLRQDIVPHSPEAEAIAKFVTTPVTLYSGSPNISIPIYEIKSSRLSLPVSLNYNYKGYRPGEEASSVGLGWSLSGGGGITRIIKGQLDNNNTLTDNYDDYVDVNALSQNQNYLQQAGLGLADTEPDLYIFNFNGYSGKFIMVKGVAIMFPHQDIKIEQAGTDGAFTITVQDGTIYHFYDTETTYSGMVQNVPWIPSHISAWFLTEIVSSDKTDTITFSYNNYAFYQRAAFSEMYTVTNATGQPAYNTQDQAFLKTTGTGSHITSKQLAHIISKNVTVDLNPETSSRLDLPQSANKALHDISISNTTGNLLKKFTLIHNYYSNYNNGQNISAYSKLNLKEVDISTASTPISKYLMQYENEDGQFPTNTEGIDIYGYYNGQNANQSLYPNNFITPCLSITGNRSPDFSYCKYGILNKITYPTGGYTTFQYEGNQFSRSSSGSITNHLGYLSVPFNSYYGNPTVSPDPGTFTVQDAQDITIDYHRTYDHDTYSNGVHNWVPIVKLYKVENGNNNLVFTSQFMSPTQEDKSQTISITPGDYMFTVTCEETSSICTTTIHYYSNATTASELNFDGPGMRIAQIQSFDNINNTVAALTKNYNYNDAQGISTAMQISWPTIGEKFISHSVGNETNIEHQYLADFNSSLNGLLDEQFYYSQVTETNNSVAESGKTVYQYSNYDVDATGVYLKTQTDYKYLGNTLVPLKNTTSNYDFINKTIINVFKSELTATHQSVGEDGTYLINPDSDDPFNRQKIYTASSVYPLSSSYKLLKNTIETSYDQNGQNPQVNEVDLYYDNPLHQFPTRKIQTNSKGEQLITEIKYPLDYDFSCSNINTIEATFNSSKQTAMNNYYSATQTRSNALSHYYLDNTHTDYDLHPYFPNTSTNEGLFTNVVNANPCEANYKSASSTIFNTRASNYTSYYGCQFDNAYFNGSESLRAISWMQRLHIISPVIEQHSIIKKGSTENLVSATKTDYKMIGNSPSIMSVPSTIYSTELQSLLLKSTFVANPNTYFKSQVSFNYDNNINLIEQHKVNDISSSYVWDYHSMYPVAEVINATNADAAHTSFEADGTGGFTITGNGASDATAPTGSKSYTLNSGYPITKAITNNTTYIVSLWAKNNGSVTVNGSAPVTTGKSINNWTYYEWKIINPASISVAANSVVIDELRLYPASAQMNTFTYIPAVGISSKCDVNNVISYFEYDGAGRLILIRDQDKNILKKFCYNYAGQPENCSTGTVTFWNNAYSTSIQRNNCGSGYTGTYVTYPVAANTFSSTISQQDADSKAINDANTNGQTYANTHGNCEVSMATVTSLNMPHVSGFTAVYTNTSTNQQYTFSIPSAAGTQTLGTLPAGVYNVVISKTGNTNTYGLGVNNFNSCGSAFFTYATSTTFYNVVVNTSSCNGALLIDTLE